MSGGDMGTWEDTSAGIVPSPPALLPPVSDRTISEVLVKANDESPDRLALVSPSGTATYAELWAEVQRAAYALHSLGIRKGDRIAVSLPNSLDIVVAFYAAAMAGAIWVGLNRQLTPTEKEFILHDCGAAVVLAEPEHLSHIDLRQFPETTWIGVEPGTRDDEWRGIVGDASEPIPTVDVGPRDPAALAYTSGTTGFPKGVLHSHRNLTVATGVQVATRGYGPDLRKVDWIPLTILNGMAVSALLVCQAGGTSIVLDSRRPIDMAQAIRAHKATSFQAVPTVLHGLVAEPSIEASYLRSLKEVLTGGGPTPEVLQEKFKAKFGRPIVNTYGLTEAPIMLALDAGDGSEHVAGASGRSLPHVDIFAANEDGRRLPTGHIGELCVAPVSAGAWAGVYTPMLEYWGYPDATSKALRDGTLHTGDIGQVDAKGNVFVMDRINSLIIRGGANVYPAEVERVICGDSRVDDCAVFGVPDERLGERVVAAVKLVAESTLTEAQLRLVCAPALAEYKVPERFMLVDEFPRNEMNKIMRAELTRIFLNAGGAT